VGNPTALFAKYVLRSLSLYGQEEYREGSWHLDSYGLVQGKNSSRCDDARAKVKDLTDAATNAGFPSTPKN
jgi:hypothetical protein